MEKFGKSRFKLISSFSKALQSMIAGKSGKKRGNLASAKAISMGTGAAHRIYCWSVLNVIDKSVQSACSFHF